MKRPAKGLLILLAVLAAVFGGGSWFLNSVLGSGMCQTSVFSQTASPSDGLISLLQTTDCGATTGFSRVVMIRKPGLWARECRALVLNGEPNVKVTWAGADIRISHDAPSSDVIAENNACFGHAIRISQEP